MFETIIALLTRGVVALENISASLASGAVISKAADAVQETVKEEAKEEAQKEDAKKDENATGSATETESAKTPRGARGGRRNKATETEEQKEEPKEDAPAGRTRRTRGEKKTDPVADTEEQAALRAQLRTDLMDLADVEEAHGEVAEALQRVGAENIEKVSSDTLDAFAADIAALITKYFD